MHFVSERVVGMTEGSTTLLVMNSTLSEEELSNGLNYSLWFLSVHRAREGWKVRNGTGNVSQTQKATGY